MSPSAQSTEALVYLHSMSVWITKLSEVHCLGFESYSLVSEIIIIDQDHFQGGGLPPLLPPKKRPCHWWYNHYLKGGLDSSTEAWTGFWIDTPQFNANHFQS
jgi:hypothetical protein